MADAAKHRVAILIAAALVGCSSVAADQLFSKANGSPVTAESSGQTGAIAGGSDVAGRSPALSGGGSPAVAGAAPTTDAGGASAAPEQGGAASTVPEVNPTAQAGAATKPEAGAAGQQGGSSSVDAKRCAGQLHMGICWYLAASGESCTATCRQHGAYDPLATSYVGTQEQGGSLAECTALFALLGTTSEVSEGTRPRDQGVGCHLFGTPPIPWWLSDPPFDPDASRVRAREICGCTE